MRTEGYDVWRELLTLTDLKETQAILEFLSDEYWHLYRFRVMEKTPGAGEWALQVTRKNDGNKPQQVVADSIKRLVRAFHAGVAFRKAAFRRH